MPSSFSKYSEELYRIIIEAKKATVVEVRASESWTLKEKLWSNRKIFQPTISTIIVLDNVTILFLRWCKNKVHKSWGMSFKGKYWLDLSHRYEIDTKL